MYFTEAVNFHVLISRGVFSIVLFSICVHKCVCLNENEAGEPPLAEGLRAPFPVFFIRKTYGL